MRWFASTNESYFCGVGKYIIADSTELTSLEDLLAAADRMCHCKTPLNAVRVANLPCVSCHLTTHKSRKFRLWLSSPVPDPPAHLLPSKQLKDDYHVEPVGLAAPQRPPVSGYEGCGSHPSYVTRPLCEQTI